MSDTINIINKTDSQFPALLSQIHSAPERLFFRGQLPDKHQVYVAVVGTRNATQYGLMVTKKLIGELARHNVAIVSGLAYGIDAQAHRATLDSGGLTVAVLAGGIDNASITPRAHEQLAKDIIESGGCVISEHPTGTQYKPYHFPARNRIIAGMCKATLVVEATLKSGTMITASSAIRENRDVMVVPGPITSQYSEGPHQLLKDGATPVTCVQDILDVLDLSSAESFAEVQNIVPASADEQIVLGMITHEPISVQELTQKIGANTAHVTQLVTLLELKSLVTNVGSGYYIKT